MWLLSGGNKFSTEGAASALTHEEGTRDSGQKQKLKGTGEGKAIGAASLPRHPEIWRMVSHGHRKVQTNFCQLSKTGN